MKVTTTAVLMLAACATLAEAKTYKEMFGTEPQSEIPGAAATVGSMDFKQGDIKLPGAHATLHVPAGYYYLDNSDTRKVLVTLWGNPGDAAGDVLGMLFPKTYSPADPRAWGATISYSDDGYVSDEDADSMDFNAVLTDLQQQTNAANEERKKLGFEKITLVGWASPPHYDVASHTIHWARDLLFGDDPQAPHTLNYQLRALAREGVLNYNFIAGINDLEQVKASIPVVTGMVTFDAGKTYGDFRDGDKMAAYGLAGLIAAGAGAKIAAKVGILALALVFLKKGAVFILVAAAAIFRPILSFFRRKPDGTA